MTTDTALALLAEGDEMNTSSNELCFWMQDSAGVWDTSCEHSFEFNDGGPDENEAKFCMYCGLKLAAQPYEEAK